jgi:hypothetical protein
MALSAYTSKGLLKKHALLGSSLAVDNKRKNQRAEYQGLHKEARGLVGGGGGRKTMRGRLQSRLNTAQQTGLADIARRKGNITNELAGLRDIDLENRLDKDAAAYAGWGKEIADNPAYSWDPSTQSDLLGGLGNTPNIPDPYRARAQTALNEIGLDKAKTKEFEDAQKDTYLVRPHPDTPDVWGLGNYGYSHDAQKKTQFNANWFEKNISGAASQRAAYDKNLNSEVDRLNQQYIPLQEQEAGRKKRIQSRLELYNMFLGG